MRRSSPDRRPRAGFTLVEVLVALVVIGIVLLGARAVLGQIADTAGRISEAAAEADREANTEALLRAVAGRAYAFAPAGREVRFSGEPRQARFHSWCEVPDGWLEPCEAQLGLIAAGGENVLALTLSTGELVPVRRGFQSGEIVYLADPAAGGEWLRSWGDGITLPLALGLVIDGDTSIIRIGERS